MVCDPHDEGVQNLAARWQHFYHVGIVPPKPVGGVVSTRGKVGRAANGQVIEWVVDSGAGLHMANEAECKV